jgi:hypothetical protein
VKVEGPPSSATAAPNNEGQDLYPDQRISIMPSDNTSPPVDRQATAKPRVVWRADGTPAIAIEEDGVVKIQKLTLVPHALWMTDHWDAPTPEWAAGIERSDEHFLAQVIHLDSLRRDAIEDIQTLLDRLRQARRLLKQGGDQAEIARLIDVVGLRARITLKGLDR